MYVVDTEYMYMNYGPQSWAVCVCTGEGEQVRSEGIGQKKEEGEMCGV